MRKKPRLLIIGHACTPTGYARVMHSLLPHLCDDFDLHHFGLNIQKVIGSYPWTIYPNAHPLDQHGLRTLEPLVRRLKPDLVLVSDNFWFFPIIAPKLNQWWPPCKVAVYFPIEGDRLSPTEVQSLNLADLAVTFTRFGMDTLQNHPDGGQLQHLTHLPHGIDVETFSPLVQTGHGPDFHASTRLARAKLFQETALQDPNAFIVLNSNRNQRSKRIDLTLEGFARFAKHKPSNVFLYLNMARDDAPYDPVLEARLLGIEHRVIVSRNVRSHAFSSEELNLLYNACDVGINTSMGEGWGLISFEHAATGKPQIVPGHSACLDLWQEHASVLIPPEGPTEYPPALKNTAIAPDALASELERLYSDQGHYNTMASKAWSFSQRPAFRWKNIAKSWGENLGRLCERESARQYS